MIRLSIAKTLCLLLALIGYAHAEDQVDASDPTKIYTYAGGGLKYTDYTNDESMIDNLMQ